MAGTGFETEAVGGLPQAGPVPAAITEQGIYTANATSPATALYPATGSQDRVIINAPVGAADVVVGVPAGEALNGLLDNTFTVSNVASVQFQDVGASQWICTGGSERNFAFLSGAVDMDPLLAGMGFDEVFHFHTRTVGMTATTSLNLNVTVDGETSVGAASAVVPAGTSGYLYKSGTFAYVVYSTSGSGLSYGQPITASQSIINSDLKSGALGVSVRSDASVLAVTLDGGIEDGSTIEVSRIGTFSVDIIASGGTTIEGDLVATLNAPGFARFLKTGLDWSLVKAARSDTRFT